MSQPELFPEESERMCCQGCGRWVLPSETGVTADGQVYHRIRVGTMHRGRGWGITTECGPVYPGEGPLARP